MKINVFGIDFDNLTMREVLEKIKGFLSDNNQHYIVLPYSEFVNRAQKDEEFRKILNQADLCLCESRGLWLIAKLSGIKLKQNIYGIELIYKINNSIQHSGSSIFLFGGIQKIVEKAKEKLGENVIGTENGYRDFDSVIEKVNKLKPNILLVGLGSPKQEKFIYENLNKMPSVKIAIGTGGAFDFISGNIKRAPKFLQKIGLEWLWRLILEPRRIRRTSKGVVGLSWLFFKNMLLLKSKPFGSRKR